MLKTIFFKQECIACRPSLLLDILEIIFALTHNPTNLPVFKNRKIKTVITKTHFDGRTTINAGC